ncbi:MAG: hypothetical protein V4687_15815 [Bacteroidota bacterium]
MKNLLIAALWVLLFAQGCKKDLEVVKENEKIEIPPDPAESNPIIGTPQADGPNTNILSRSLNLVVGYNKNVFLDVDADGMSDFSFFGVLIYHDNRPNLYLAVTPKTSKGSRVLVKTGEEFLINGLWSAPLEKDVVIQEASPSDYSWTGPQVKGYIVASSKTAASDEYYGLWIGKADKYLGIKFKLNNKYHYGWVRISHTKSTDELMISDYAYNTIPEQGIAAGQN